MGPLSNQSSPADHSLEPKVAARRALAELAEWDRARGMPTADVADVDALAELANWDWARGMPTADAADVDV